jgi:hypothetical protein
MDCTSLPFTRQVNRSFGSESSQVPFYALFVLFVVDCKCRFWVHRPLLSTFRFLLCLRCGQ